MSFRHDMRGKTHQQQAIVRQRDREERRRKEEAEKRKEQEEAQGSVEYSFDFDDVKKHLSEDEYERLLREVDKYKVTIIKHLLIEEDRGNETLCTPITTKESKNTSFFELFSKEFCFTRDGNVIKATRR